jgi:hypothetical protein
MHFGTFGARAGAMALVVSAVALPTAANASTAVTAVNEALIASVRAAPIPPPRVSRAISMVGISMFDAVNATHMGYDGYSYAGPAVKGMSQDALAIAAGYTMIANLFPTLAPGLMAEMNMKLAALPISNSIRTKSLAFGSGIANDFFNDRLADGSATAQFPYVPGVNPGDFQPTAPTDPVLPGWGNVDTFAATSSSQFSNGAPPALGSAEWIADYEEVRLLGCATCGTLEQQTIAKFWADGGGTFTPPGHWLNITNTLIAGLSTLDAARATAFVGMSVADAGITAWNDKYTQNWWRPVTAINNCTMADCGVAPEPGWTPFLSTPNFPSFVSGHSSFSGGAAGALAGFFGTDALAFCTPADPLSGVVGDRCFASLTAAADEAGISRIYGGIHYEHDNGRAVDNAYSLGQFVSETQLARVGAIPEASTWAMLIAGFGMVGGAVRRRRLLAA